MNNYIFITGATSGFGKACAELYAKNNWNLILTGRREERLISLANELKEMHNVDVITLAFDVRNEAEVIKATDYVPLQIQEKVEILINNAGLAVGRGPLENGVTDDWERMIDTNIKGLLYVSKQVIPWLKAKKSGHIINIASIAGKEVYPGGNVYCASKHAVDALSKAMRIDLVDYSIKVTNIAPGAAETEFSLVRFKGNKETANSVYDGYKALEAIDIAETIYFVTNTPKHVTINDLTIMPTAQASASIFNKE
jgi:3-hydroxy acid dehydrogenase / malonic semialdehyde reductase